MKFVVLITALTFSLFASAKNLQCLPEGEADGSVVELVNVENIARGKEFGARFLPKEQNVVSSQLAVTQKTCHSFIASSALRLQVQSTS